MLCPEVWSFDSPALHAKEIINREWNDAAKEKLNANISRNHELNQFVTVIFPNCPEEEQDRLNNLIQDRGSCYTVTDLDLEKLIDPTFVRRFVSSGHFFGLSTSRHPTSDCIVSIVNGTLNISLNKETFQSLSLEGQPVQSSRKKVDKYREFILLMVAVDMGKIKQPRSLQEEAVKSMGDWICKLIVGCTPHYQEMGQFMPAEFVEILRKSIANIKDLLDASIPYHLREATRRELFRVLPDFIEDIRWIEENGPEDDTRKLPSVNIALAFTDLLISADLQKLNIENVPRIMRVIFYSSLKDMTWMRDLNMGCMSGGWKTLQMEGSVLKAVENMKNLQHLVLKYDATDSLIKLLTEVCPKILSVDFSCSKYITNESIDLVVKLKALRTVYVENTGVTMEGYIKMLLNLKNLEDLGHYDELGRCLEYIDHHHPNKTDLKLKTFISNYATTDHIEAMAKNCPDINKVAIFCNSTLIDLMCLVGINRLSDLKLRASDYYTDQVHQLIQVKGCNLTHLHFEHVDEVDKDALINISQNCPGLRELILYNCDLIEDRSLIQRKWEIPPFANLERLTLAIQCDQEHLEFLLESAVNIKSIHMGTKVPVTDDFFEGLLKKNPMKNLEQLRIMFSDQLTIASAYLLLESCDQLCHLGELECWEQVTHVDLLEFIAYVRANNYELDVTSQKFMCRLNLVKCCDQDSKYAANVLKALKDPKLPKVNFQFKWEPPQEQICPSSVGKFFNDWGYPVTIAPCEVKVREELSQRVASFSDMENCEEITEYLGILALNCNDRPDDYLTSYTYSGDMVRVKNVTVLMAKGFFTHIDLRNFLDSTTSSFEKNSDSPWMAVIANGFNRTPFCKLFFEDFPDVSTARNLTFLLNAERKSLIHQILPITKDFCSGQKRNK